MTRLYLPRASIMITLWFFLAQSGVAHPWQEGASDLSPVVIEQVVSTFEAAAQNAPAERAPGQGADEDTVLSFKGFAAEAGLLNDLPPETSRILITYDALRRGIVTNGGTLVDPADFFEWHAVLHPPDVAAVVPFLVRLDALNQQISGGAP